MSQLNLMEEIQRCREEMGGPFFNKRENQRLRQQQEQLRQQEEMRGSMRGGRGTQLWHQQQRLNSTHVVGEPPVVRE